MSRSNNTDVRNPAKRFFQWSGSDGSVKYYDKEEKKNIYVDLPFHFLVLDRLVTITGYSDADASGIWSNEIRNTKQDILTVRTKHGIKKSALYEDVKTVVGAKYAQSLYIAFFDENKQLQLGNFKLSGCAVSAWIEFTKGKDIFKGAMKIAASVEGKKGATKYFSPVFETVESIKPETEEAAIGLDKELQEYLTAYLALRGSTVEKTQEEQTDEYIEERNRELEFEPEKASAATASVNPPEWSGADDDIPF